MSWDRFELVDEGGRGKFSIVDKEQVRPGGPRMYNCRNHYDMEELVNLLNQIDCRAKFECEPEELDFS